MTSGEADNISGREGGQFPLTLWSMILRAGDPASPDNREALSRFCVAYWYPLYAFVRRRGRSEADAKDLIQGFFTHLLERDGLASVAPGRGKFRSYLLTCLRHYISNVDARAQAVVHGGGVPHVPIDPGTTESHCGVDPADFNSPDRQLDRDWALTVLEHTMARLKAEQEAAGHDRLFELLSPRLTDAPLAPEYEAVASELGMTVTAVRTAKSRLIVRYRELLRAEVARTVGSPAEVDGEIRHLFGALTS